MEVECRFCKNEFDDSQAFKIVEPGGKSTDFCPDCAADLVRHIESGEADRENMDRSVLLQTTPSNDLMDSLSASMMLNSYGNTIFSSTVMPKLKAQWRKSPTVGNGIKMKDLDEDTI